MLMFSLEYKRIFAILSGLGGKNGRIRDVSSPGMTDKTIAKFEGVAAFANGSFTASPEEGIVG